MDFDRSALKKRLLEIARRESIKFGEDAIELMKKNIKLEQNLVDKWVKIIYIGGDIKRQAIDKESFEELLRKFASNGTIPEYGIIEGKDYIQFQFKDEEIVRKVHDHYHNFFFGNMQQQLVNDHLAKYINELIDEGCATGSCGCDAQESCEMDPSDENK